MMDQQDYEQWWQLHLRVAKGEQLSAADQAVYEAGLETLDQTDKVEQPVNNLSRLRQLQTHIETLRTAHTQLMVKSSQLDVQIMDLEKMYQTLTGYTLTYESS